MIAFHLLSTPTVGGNNPEIIFTWQVAMVELDTNISVSSEMLTLFALCTTLLVAVHIMALMISTCILPNLDAVSNLHDPRQVHQSPHERFHWCIELAWTFSTLFGMLLFLVEVSLLCWVWQRFFIIRTLNIHILQIKFYKKSPSAAWSACVLMVPVVIIFLLFAWYFYRTLVEHKYEVSELRLREMEALVRQLDQSEESLDTTRSFKGVLRIQDV